MLHFSKKSFRQTASFMLDRVSVRRWGGESGTAWVGRVWSWGTSLLLGCTSSLPPSNGVDCLPEPVTVQSHCHGTLQCAGKGRTANPANRFYHTHLQSGGSVKCEVCGSYVSRLSAILSQMYSSEKTSSLPPCVATPTPANIYHNVAVAEPSAGIKFRQNKMENDEWMEKNKLME